jgi:hypothetical protein
MACTVYMHSHGLDKHSVVRSCQLFFKIYFFIAHIAQTFLKGHGSAFRDHESAGRGRESARSGQASILEIKSTLGARKVRRGHLNTV